MSFKKEEKLFLLLCCISKLKNPSVTRIQKTLFIYTQEYDPNILMYVPNNYGANSFELLEEINFLVHNDFIIKERDENSIKYRLIKKGKEILKKEKLQEKYEHEKQILLEIVNHVNYLKSSLVSYVYNWYPKYIEKSLILDEIIERMSDDRKKDATRSIQILRKRIQEKQNN